MPAAQRLNYSVSASRINGPSLAGSKFTSKVYCLAHPPLTMLAVQESGLSWFYGGMIRGPITCDVLPGGRMLILNRDWIPVHITHRTILYINAIYFTGSLAA